MIPDIAAKGHSFNGAFAYYLHDKGKDTSERVGWTETRNLASDNPEMARKIMIATAQQSDQLKMAAGVKVSGRKSTKHVYAYSLSWHPDEAANLDRAAMIAAADDTLKELEADHLQSVIVCHTDQKHPHVHIILNRVDPTDGRMHPFKNDRLKLSDWANRYERDRGHIVTPAREEKRKKREQNSDLKARQDYARRKRAEAASRPRSEFSEGAMLKDLQDSQKAQHRQSWRDLANNNKGRRTGIYNDYRDRIRAVVAKQNEAAKPVWAEHFRKERERKQEFDRREKSIIGRVQNAWAATAMMHMGGEGNGKGKLADTFTHTIDTQRRRRALEGQLAHERQVVRRSIKAATDEAVTALQDERKASLASQRSAFTVARQDLIEQQNQDEAKMREAWRQYHRRRQMEDKPVKRDFDASKTPQKPARPQPTRQATVSTPSPSPAPRGEIPRSTAKTTTVPRSKDWTDKTANPEPKGLSSRQPAKKDWSKAAGSKPEATPPPKDWGKKAERSTDRKPPSPRRDLDRSR